MTTGVATPPLGGSSKSPREEFLMEMYSRLWDNISRHVTISWQAITAVFTATAALALSEKRVLNVDVAASLVLIVCAWAVCHYYDASAWYNRNLVIVANIERQFLKDEDVKEIHFYFTRHRNPTMIEHFKLHSGLVIAIGLLVLGYHFAERVLPGLRHPGSSFEFSRAVPYAVAVVGLVSVWMVRHAVTAKYRMLLTLSPGKPAPPTPQA
jgi:hypothetical protein